MLPTDYMVLPLVSFETMLKIFCQHLGDSHWNYFLVLLFVLVVETRRKLLFVFMEYWHCILLYLGFELLCAWFLVFRDGNRPRDCICADACRPCSHVPHPSHGCFLTFLLILLMEWIFDCGIGRMGRVGWLCTILFGVIWLCHFDVLVVFICVGFEGSDSSGWMVTNCL